MLFRRGHVCFLCSCVLPIPDSLGGLTVSPWVLVRSHWRSYPRTAGLIAGMAWSIWSLSVCSAAAPGTQPASAAAQSQTQVRVIRFLEDRVRRDPEDAIALNRLANEYLRRFRDTGDDHDLEL